MIDKIRKTALLNVVYTTVYVIVISLFLGYGSNIKIGKVSPFIASIVFLLLFVFSAALTGFLVVGKPLQLYIDGKKKDALSLLFYTLIFLFILTLISIFILLSFIR